MQRRIRSWVVLLLASAALVLARSVLAGKAEHVVVVVWDGMRRDLISETNTPTLAKLAREGVFFANHHPVYITSTEVNGTALATGAYPAHNGIMANREYRPSLDPLKPIDTQSLEAVRKSDQLTGNRHVALPTVAEIVQRAGYRTAVAGAKAVALLHDRFDEDRTCSNCVNYFAGQTIPAGAPAQGKGDAFPAAAAPNIQRDEVTVQTLIRNFWTGDLPKFSLLWLSEPDYSQHNRGLGSNEARAALQNNDRNLARVLNELEDRGARAKTDIFVVSDHGFSTISRAVDVAAVLQTNGFKAARTFDKAPADDSIMVVSNGGSVLFYVIGHDRGLTTRLVEFLQQQDFVGVVFTREKSSGTFTLDRVGIDTADAPDVVISLRWSTEKNEAGVPGMVGNDGTARPGRGAHGSLSRFDLHNTLIAAGPDFRQGMTDQLPSGNADVAPTILSILGIQPPQPMDGRILTEAFVDGDVARVPVAGRGNAAEPAAPSPIEVQELATQAPVGQRQWRQYLRVIKYSGATYFDEGNGGLAPR